MNWLHCCIAGTVLFCAAMTANAAQSAPHLLVFTGDDDSGGVTCTLICGTREAILVDNQVRNSQAKKLSEQIAAVGRHLKAIIIRHPDKDHCSGTAVQEFKRTSDSFIAALKKGAPSETPERLLVPEVLPATILTVDGEAAEVIEDFQGDVLQTLNSFLWFPSQPCIPPWLSRAQEECGHSEFSDGDVIHGKIPG